MNNRDYKYSFIISLWGAAFLGTTEQELSEAIKIFHIDWFDIFKIVVMGIMTGFLLRTKRVRSYLEYFPLGKLITGSFLGIVGLGSLVGGILGSIIVYLKFNNIEFIQLPLHAIWVGLSDFFIYLIMHWRKKII